MDLAFCLTDNKLWDGRHLSDEVKNHSAEWIEIRRDALICCGCEKKARFVDATKKNPYFGISPGYEHDADCDFTKKHDGRKAGTGTPLPVRAPASGNKEVRYAECGPLVASPATVTSGRMARRAGTVPAGTGGPLHETTSLRTLLKNLRNRDDYPPEDLYLDVPVRGPAVRAKDYFCRIAALTTETPADGVTRAYWGAIHLTDDWSAGSEGKKTLWIYCDHVGKVFTIRLDHEVKDKLYAAMQISDGSKLEGAHVIVEGVMRRGKKLSINVTDLTKIAFLPKRQS